MCLPLTQQKLQCIAALITLQLPNADVIRLAFVKLSSLQITSEVQVTLHILTEKDLTGTPLKSLEEEWYLSVAAACS